MVNLLQLHIRRMIKHQHKLLTNEIPPVTGAFLHENKQQILPTNQFSTINYNTFVHL